MTLDEHAAAIQAALDAAAADGFYADNGDMEPVYMELNRYNKADGRPDAWYTILVPEQPF